MNTIPEKLLKKLEHRSQKKALRSLSSSNDRIDFSSNDYLGFSVSENIFKRAGEILKGQNLQKNGATGSRLLSGNHELYEETEKALVNFHNAASALVFNSGYDANVGFFSSVPQRGDIILYDECIHASIRDGITMSTAKSYKFKHNSVDDLNSKLQSLQEDSPKDQEIYVVTESIFSMDGDMPDILSVVRLCEQYHGHLIVDEAHALGVFGAHGSGLLQELGVEEKIFARIITFGKALGCHGAAILGSENLKSYLINFARSFIYTTGLPPHSLATIQAAYQDLHTTSEINRLQENSSYFNHCLESLGITSYFIPSTSAIHCCVISGNENVKRIAAKIQNKGFDVKAILSPTVPEGKERLRFCLHSYNSKKEILGILKLLKEIL